MKYLHLVSNKVINKANKDLKVSNLKATVKEIMILKASVAKDKINKS